MAGRGSRGRPALPRDVPESSTPGGASSQGGRAQQHGSPAGQADLPPPPELGGLLQAIPGLVQALQQQAQTQAAMMAHIQTGMAAPAAHQERVAELERAHGASMMERVQRMGPPSFKGESSPDVAEGWIRETEKIFRAIRCLEEDKVPLATFTLQDRADVWWTSTLRTVFPRRDDVAWEKFLQVFRERFFPGHVQE